MKESWTAHHGQPPTSPRHRVSTIRVISCVSPSLPSASLPEPITKWQEKNTAGQYEICRRHRSTERMSLCSVQARLPHKACAYNPPRMLRTPRFLVFCLSSSGRLGSYAAKISEDLIIGGIVITPHLKADITCLRPRHRGKNCTNMYLTSGRILLT